MIVIISFFCDLASLWRVCYPIWHPFELNIDMAAKRHKKHKNKISDLVISMGYNE